MIYRTRQAKLPAPTPWTRLSKIKNIRADVAVVGLQTWAAGNAVTGPDPLDRGGNPPAVCREVLGGYGQARMIFRKRVARPFDGLLFGPFNIHFDVVDAGKLQLRNGVVDR